MKKSLIVLMGAFIIAATTGIVFADSSNNVSLNSAIRMYKSGNYTQAYTSLQAITAREPRNVLAHYYLAMSCSQIGKKSEAIENYSKVISLSDNSHLTRYAMKGLNCLESPSKCNDDMAGETDLDRFIRRQYGNGFTDSVTSDYDTHRIDELRRMINRGEEIPPSKFREFRDFSSEVPTNDEIVKALDVLKKAGMYDIIANNNYDSGLAFLQESDNEADFLRMMFSDKESEKVSPEVIQALLTNQMTIGF